jgi:ABC-2 type transport system ATP-binding protein
VAAIEIEHLTKRYGARRGIDDVSFAVPEATLFGFIGPNGAGKTTTIRILLGLLAPSGGSARLFGIDAVTDGPRARGGVGYVPSEVHVYPRMRVDELLDYLGRFHPGDHRARRGELCTFLDLDTRAPAADLSLGNRKKVAIVAALQHRPRLAILDEPSTGLDPVMQARLQQLLRDEVTRGATVLLSSHVLAEVETLCKTVAVIREGRLVAVEDIAALRTRAVRRVRARFIGDVPAGFADLPGARDPRIDGGQLSFVYDGEVPPLLAALAAAAPHDVAIEEPSLEDIFLRYYAGGGDV